MTRFLCQCRWLKSCKIKVQQKVDSALLNKHQHKIDIKSQDVTHDIVECAQHSFASLEGFVGRYGVILSSICHNRKLLAKGQSLRLIPILALINLMFVSKKFCQNNVAILNIWLRHKESSLRHELLFKVGDLILRWPNVLEPWGEYLIPLMFDSENEVRKNTLILLSRFLLRNLIASKAYLIALSTCVIDTDEIVRAIARMSFLKISQNDQKQDNLFSEIIFVLISNAIEPNTFRSIVVFLINFVVRNIEKERLMEKIVIFMQSKREYKRTYKATLCLSLLGITESDLVGINVKYNDVSNSPVF
jgi:condensin complex subunit 1